MILLTDGSVDPRRGVGFGAYLALGEVPEDIQGLGDLIRIKQFTNTSSTQLELRTLLWALSEIAANDVICYTDSKNIVGLPARKERLTTNQYCSKSGEFLKNHELYREFYAATEKLNIQFHRLSGHLPSSKQQRMNQIFALVDRAARRALRAE